MDTFEKVRKNQRIGNGSNEIVVNFVFLLLQKAIKNKKFIFRLEKRSMYVSAIKRKTNK